MYISNLYCKRRNRKIDDASLGHPKQGTQKATKGKLFVPENIFFSCFSFIFFRCLTLRKTFLAQNSFLLEHGQDWF